MVGEHTLDRLFEAFPDGFINRNLEFIALEKTNSFIGLRELDTSLDVEYSLLENMSRDAYKTQWFDNEKTNRKWQDYLRGGINKFCGTDYSREDMALIYDALGNGVRPSLTKRFVANGRDTEWLKQELEKERNQKKSKGCER